MTKKLFLVDDNDADLTLMRMALANAGFSVLAFNSAREAVNRIATENPDLFVTDILMDDMEGVETLQHVIHNHPALPVVVISGALEILHLMTDLGAAAAVVKTVDYRGLVDACLRVLTPSTS